MLVDLLEGQLEQAPFVIVADEGCCTRYDGSRLPALLAVDKMNDYALPLITDFIGGKDHVGTGVVLSGL